MRINTVFWLVIVALACLLWLPNLFTIGMFGDGVIDALVAKNFAEGNGSFFSLQENYFANTQYSGNPPLAFVLQGYFFKVFGTAFFIEKIYSLLCALIQLLLIKKIWETLFDEPEMQALSFLPCLLWLISPLAGRSYSGNLLENTMSIFTSAALLFVVMYVRRGKMILLYALPAALLILCAVLSKGPVGLYVLAAPIFFIDFTPGYNRKNAIAFTAMLWLLFAAAFGLLLLNSEARQFFSAYLQQQIQPALGNTPESLAGRFKILLHLSIVLSTIIGVLIAVKLLNRTPVNSNAKNAGRFLCLGLAASLPIMLSYKQNSFYLLPALPVFAIGFALLMADDVRTLLQTAIKPVYTKVVTAIAIACVVVSIALSAINFATIGRDKEMLEDAKQIADIVKTESCLSAGWNVYSEYGFRAYLSRLHGKTVFAMGSDCRSPWALDRVVNRNNEQFELVYQGKFVNLYRRK